MASNGTNTLLVGGLMRLHKFIDQEMIIYMMLLHSIRTPGGHPGYLEVLPIYTRILL
jgi:hypothetical protein